MSRAVFLIAIACASPLCAAAAPSAKLSDFIRLRLVDGSLVIDWVAANPPPHKPIVVQGPEARWSVRSPRAFQGVAPGTLELERPPAGTKEKLGYWSIFVSSAPDRLYLTGHRGGRAAVETTLRVTQTPDGALHLVVMNQVTRTFTQARAANVVELRATHPQLVRQYLVPLLRQLSGDDPLVPGATDVYRAFSEISADVSIVESVRALLPGLADPSYATRQQASAQLSALGPQGVCAILRIDRDDLLPEQQLRLENLLAINSHRLIEDPQTARRDASFLADCLEFDDDRVRRVAKRELEQILQRPIPLHPAPTEAEWSQAADVVRARLAREVLPAQD